MSGRVKQVISTNIFLFEFVKFKCKYTDKKKLNKFGQTLKNQK